ncbi:AB-hydrolase YheT [Schizophyllum commune H4-8]|uniref:AB hydrolase-1 domain-containing protein n=1 Tax=Schizophyllum commune (strain H4-8 / FGSC 9210) TaxID=578458 RepID=D8QIP8_SCHCM|nr:AB-hydrolase YheT [Schizophyllum commune H4-8]KAI5886093.1 AB-hydrolase YheT [Schizophyllum commune H4-8]
MIDLRTLVKERCPSLYKRFRPAWWLPNGHIQTIYAVLGDFTKVHRFQYRRQFIRMRDGGTVGMDWAPADQFSVSDTAPIIVIKHGITGGSHEPYVRCILDVATAPVSQGGLGYRAVVCNFRGCAGIPITSPRLYSSGATDDLRQELAYIRSLYPNAPLIGLGFSLGANVLTRYLAEEGEESRLVAGCAVACPWNLLDDCNGLLNTFLGTQIYSKGMARSLRKIVKRNRTAFASGAEQAAAVEAALKLKSPTLKVFDDHFTRLFGGGAPMFPFDSAQDYYTGTSSHTAVRDIRVPFLALNAADDPIVNKLPALDGSDNVVLAVTRLGGHLAWFEAGKRPGEPRRWMRQPVLEWLRVCGDDLKHEAMGRKEREVVVVDGWVTEAGSEEGYGCRALSGSKIIEAHEDQNRKQMKHELALDGM